MNLLDKVPPKLRPIALGGLVGLPIGLFFLIHKTTPKTGAKTGAGNASGSFSYHGTGIPVGSPNDHDTTTIINRFPPVVHRTPRGHAHARLSFLEGARGQLLRAMAFERHWLAGYERNRKRGGHAGLIRISELERRLGFQRRTLKNLNSEIGAAKRRTRRG